MTPQPADSMKLLASERKYLRNLAALLLEFADPQSGWTGDQINARLGIAEEKLKEIDQRQTSAKR